MENAQTKGMSKGCLILLIVGGVILVLAILLAVGCYIYKDDLAKLGGTTLIDSLKTELAAQDFEGVDTVQFNAMADACKERLNAEDPLDWERYSLFMGTVQLVMEDKEITADEVPVMQKAFVDYFPDLEELMPAESTESEDSTTVAEDSLMTE